jgi:hypothetical protein
MNLSSVIICRHALYVPSMHCQSLLEKALQEHFTKPEEIASVFSSSPSLRNSSAGANFLTNFKLDGKSIDLFRIVFTPEDCFSVQFAFKIIIDNSSDFSFLKNLTKTKYIEASLRSLTISTQLIDDEQLVFILSNLKRLTTLELNLHRDSKITSTAINAIAENLSELTNLEIYSSAAVTTSALEFLALRLKKLNILSLQQCDVNLSSSSVEYF